jgi:tRNA(Arg) A34 adenosine deaminase TadA
MSGPDKTSGRWGRRCFLAGLLSGGLGGSLITWLVQHWARPRLPPPKGTAAPFPDLDHATFMRRAIAQAKSVPLLPFGAVLVRGATGEVLAEGHNRSASNPTFHGEIDVIHRLAAAQPEVDWASLVLDTTAEPCPMCQSAVEWAGIPLVVYGTSIPFLQGLGWWQIDIRAEEVVRRTPFRRSTVLGGILEAECNALFEAVPRQRGG